MTNSEKIILNTIVSYVALLLKMVVGLFVVRFVLQALGEVDYGIYIIVGGIVSMLDILNTNMSNTSMRYLAYSLGKKDKVEIYTTFNTTVFLHYLIGFITILLLELGGYLMFKYMINIPLDRIGDAQVIFQFMVITSFISIISVPYDAVTNAHEKIWMLSVFDIVSILLGLAVSLFLLVYDGNKLVMYGLLLMLIQIAMRIAKVSYAKHKFEECKKIKLEHVARHRMLEIVSFTGWNLFGSIASLGMTQFRSLILNMFFGVRLNAAEGICRQVGSPLNMIVVSMTRAINPQIMKSEGGQDREKMKYIVAIGAKYSTFLFALLGIPVLIEIPFLLELWLDKVPEYAVVFCQLTIIGMLIEKLTFQIVHAVSAVGNIRNFQIAGTIANFIYLPIAWIAFKCGYSPVAIYILSLLSLMIMAIVRLYYGKTVAEIDPILYIRTAVYPVISPLLVSAAVALLINRFVIDDWVNLVSVSFAFFSCFIILFWFWGMDKKEHERWLNMVKKIR